MKNNKDKKTTEQDQLRNPTTHEVLREVQNESSEERVSGDRDVNDSRINNNPQQQNTSDEKDNTRSVAGPGGERKRQTGSGLTPKRSVTGSDLDGQTA